MLVGGWLLIDRHKVETKARMMVEACKEHHWWLKLKALAQESQRWTPYTQAMKALPHTSQPSSQPPPFMYINDADAIQTTIAVIDNVLDHISSAPGPSKISYAHADAIACFSARLLYESVIYSLASWTPQWEDGAVNWGADNGVRWNDTFDGFMHGLRTVHVYLGEGKEKEGGVRLVIVVERAERLIPELMVPLTRLAELVSSSFSLLAQLTLF